MDAQNLLKMVSHSKSATWVTHTVTLVTLQLDKSQMKGIRITNKQTIGLLASGSDSYILLHIVAEHMHLFFIPCKLHLQSIIAPSV